MGGGTFEWHCGFCCCCRCTVNVSLLLPRQEWNYDDKTFPSAPVGDAVALSASLLAKYATPPSAPARTYTKYADSDAPCTGCDLTRAWTTDVAQLQLLCNTDPTCAGFVSTGYLKNSTTTKTSSPGNDLYVKNV
jgi:hypothetical protein